MAVDVGDTAINFISKLSNAHERSINLQFHTARI